MPRPDHLPDFTDPPLDEVVLGIQFSPVPGYTAIDSMDVWSLFKGEFPNVEEHSVLEPQFETFGGANVQAGPKIRVGSLPIGSRLWFLSEDGNHLLQFQPDRFVANWRRQPNAQVYPRFEGLCEAFEANVGKLRDHLKRRFDHNLEINQVEVGYINIIPVDEFSEMNGWLKMWENTKIEIEALNISFNEVFKSNDEKPYARLNHQIQSVYTSNGKRRAYRLSLVFKGKPAGEDIASAIAFLQTGRDAIVTRFGEITTERAQQAWGRVK